MESRRWPLFSSWERSGASPVSRHLILTYDEIYSIRFFSAKLRPYWRRNGATPAVLLETRSASIQS